MAILTFCAHQIEIDHFLLVQLKVQQVQNLLLYNQKKFSWKFMCIYFGGKMANQVVQVVLRCEAASETDHLGNKQLCQNTIQF